MQEAELLRRVIEEDDHAAFETLVEAYQAGATALAEKLLRDRFAAEEAAQDAFAEFYFSRARFRGGCTFKTYLFAILRHKCLDRLRRRGEDPAQLAEDAPAIPSPEESYERQESCEEAFALMRALPGRQLDTLWRYAVQGQSYREIAAQTGRSEVQIRVEVYRARKTLRRMRRENDGT